MSFWQGTVAEYAVGSYWKGVGLAMGEGRNVALW